MSSRRDRYPDDLKACWEKIDALHAEIDRLERSAEMDCSKRKDQCIKNLFNWNNENRHKLREKRIELSMQVRETDAVQEALDAIALQKQIKDSNVQSLEREVRRVELKVKAQQNEFDTLKGIHELDKSALKLLHDTRAMCDHLYGENGIVKKDNQRLSKAYTEIEEANK